jgi:hypothetical protein
MASLKEGVKGITVVEWDKDIIHIFERYILPQFPQKGKVEIVAMDAFEYIEGKMPDEKFDFAFVDLWHDASDGLDAYLKIKKLEHCSCRTKFIYWAEDSLLSRIRWQIFDWVARNARSYVEITECLSKSFLQKIATTITRV